jgi:HAD superfamily hydrolase (TIGR01509 family)
MFTVIFDNDGVLVDTETLFFRANREVLASAGITLTEEWFIEHSMKRGRSTIEIAFEYGCDQGQVDALREKRDRHYSHLLKESDFKISGVDETLRALHGRVSMGIVTSCRKMHFEVMHSRHELLPYFDFVYTREDCVRSKPDPEPYLQAVRRRGLDPERCLVVEDSERGCAAAHAAGLQCIVIPNALTHGANFCGARKVLDDIRQLVPEVLNLAGIA